MDEKIKHAINQKLAATLLDSLAPEHLRAVLAEAVTELLGAWNTKAIVSAAVTERVAEVTAEIIRDRKFEEAMRKAIEIGISNAMEILATGTEESVLRYFTIDGDRKNYGIGFASDMHRWMKNNMTGD